MRITVDYNRIVAHVNYALVNYATCPQQDVIAVAHTTGGLISLLQTKLLQGAASKLRASLPYKLIHPGSRIGTQSGGNSPLRSTDNEILNIVANVLHKTRSWKMRAIWRTVLDIRHSCCGRRGRDCQIEMFRLSVIWLPSYPIWSPRLAGLVLAFRRA